MIIDIFNEIPWQAFQNLEYIKKLPLNEQKEKYDKYISEVELARDDYYQYQVKGPRTGESPPACALGMDVIFCIDFTGSMGTAINAIKTDIASIVNTIITESNNDYRLGLVIFDAYRDGQPVDYASSLTYQNLPASQKIITPSVLSGPGSGSPNILVYQALTSLVEMSTNNQTDFNDVLQQLNTPNFTPPDIDGLELGGGAIADGPEPGDLAIEEIINNDFAGAFRSKVAKLIITISDNYPGGYKEDYDADVISRLQALVTTSVANDIQHLAMIDLSPSQKLNPDPMAPNTGYRILTDNTSGEFVNSFDPTSIITAIQDICTENA
jgi:hypothetical protein